MLALGILDSMLTFDVAQQWLTYMSSKGYVQHIVDSLLQDDDELQAMLSPQPAPLKALYIYQSKMVYGKCIIRYNLYLFRLIYEKKFCKKRSSILTHLMCKFPGFTDKSSRISNRSADPATMWTNDTSR